MDIRYFEEHFVPPAADLYGDDEPSASTSSTSSSSQPSTTSNPNTVRRSHFGVLATGGQKGSWSIETTKKPKINVDDFLKGNDGWCLNSNEVLDRQVIGDLWNS